MAMTTEEKLKLITRNLEEVLTEEELKKLIESDTPLKHYIGFEISGKLHIGYLFTCLKVKDLQDAGAEVTIWLADLHSAINDKLGGDLETIKKTAREYFQPAFSALFDSIGGDSSKLNFKLCSETYAQNPDFWFTFLEVGKATTLSRTKRSITIMGREKSDDSIETAKLFYPIMQAADIFLLQANIAHAGMDQRKVHVIAREAAMQVKTFPLKDYEGNQIKPIAIHHPILLSLSHPASSIDYEEVLTEDQDHKIDLLTKDEKEHDDNRDIAAMRMKMSKSKTEGGILIHDSSEDIKNKINAAYAPEGDIQLNPVLNWTRNLVFYDGDGSLEIKRDGKFGGDITYKDYEDLEKDYANKKLHPMDLKIAVTKWLVNKLEPARKYFEDPKRKAALEEIERLTLK